MAIQYKARACGKFVLVGEHVVVHQECPAIAFPLKNLFCEVMLPPHIGLEIQSNIPVGRGFGSSAALVVALVRELQKKKKSLIPEGEDMKLLSELESHFHGSSSGLDTTTVWHEKPIYFKSIHDFSFIHSRILDFVVVDSGSRKDCKEMVSHIQAFRKNFPQKWRDDVIKPMNEIVEGTRKSLEDGDEHLLAQSIDEAHSILRRLELSTPLIEETIDQAKSCGALAGKVSGAGGGGALLFLAKKGEARYLCMKLKERGIDVIQPS